MFKIERVIDVTLKKKPVRAARHCEEEAVLCSAAEQYQRRRGNPDIDVHLNMDAWIATSGFLLFRYAAQ